MPSPEHNVLNHQEKLVCAERVLQESLGELEALIPSHDLNAKKALRDARAAANVLPKVASSTAKGIGMGYAWRHREIEHAGTLAAPRKPLQELTKYCGGNSVPIALFQPKKRPPSPKNDERHLRSQCAEAPVFKMPKLSKGAFYDAQTAVELCVDCEELTGRAVVTTAKELLRTGKVNVGLSAIRDRVRIFKKDKEIFGVEKARARIKNWNQRGRPYLDPKPSFKHWMVTETQNGRAVGRQEIEERLRTLKAERATLAGKVSYAVCVCCGLHSLTHGCAGPLVDTPSCQEHFAPLPTSRQGHT
jgi:hypothetical protein